LPLRCRAVRCRGTCGQRPAHARDRSHRPIARRREEARRAGGLQMSAVKRASKAKTKAASRETTPRAQLDAFIDRYSAEVAKQGRTAFAKMRKLLPAGTVLVYDNYNALAIGFGPGEQSSKIVFSIALYPRWVSLFFAKGVGLPDPHRLLKGSGS